MNNRYLVSVVFSHTSITVFDSFSRDITFSISSEVMETDFRPNTESGLKTIADILEREHPNYRNVTIVNLIPLEREKTIVNEDDTE